MKEFVCSILATDLEDDPVIVSLTAKLSNDKTFKYLLVSFQETTTPVLSPVLTISPSANSLTLDFAVNLGISNQGITLPDDDGPLKMPGLVTVVSNL